MTNADAALFPIIAQDCLCRKARMADRTITRAYDEALRPCGLRITQFTLLVAIGYGSPGSIGELADWLAMERTTLTRNLKLLENEGLIISHAGAHHRSRAMTLSTSGRAKLDQAYPLWQSVQKMYREELGPQGWQESHEAMIRLANVGR
ncbi:MAG: MarR family transcriptional regulator [Gammaproteobacteria bacterium HGW-Gammaproteobacteria-11]|nr:MAG: MarR family transcriptional regulator [Gammaproteobacteria bacterium HGW-Gammaproteobacteria-11]